MRTKKRETARKCDNASEREKDGAEEESAKESELQNVSVIPISTTSNLRCHKHAQIKYICIGNFLSYSHSYLVLL